MQRSSQEALAKRVGSHLLGACMGQEWASISTLDLQSLHLGIAWGTVAWCECTKEVRITRAGVILSSIKRVTAKRRAGAAVNQLLPAVGPSAGALRAELCPALVATLGPGGKK